MVIKKSQLARMAYYIEPVLPEEMISLTFSIFIYNCWLNLGE